MSSHKTIPEVLDKHVVFDEFVEEITPETKEFIDIATDTEVIDSIKEAGYLSYLITLFTLIKKYPVKASQLLSIIKVS